MPRPLRIGIIGAGFTGSVLAAHLLRGADALEAYLIERGPAIGTGVAYSTRNPGHLLNVRVANMSAFPDDPAHFLKWLWARDETGDPERAIPPSGHAFVSRRTYGTYVRDVLRQAMVARPERAKLTIVKEAAVAIQTDPSRARNEAPVRLTLSGGNILALDQAVLCVGNFPPSRIRGMEDEAVTAPRFIADPWDWPRMALIARGDRVLVVGAGLTMVDVIDSLDQAGHHGPIHVLSRHGLLPHRHEPTRTWQLSFGDDPLPRSLTALTRALRDEVAAAELVGHDWRSVIDALRSRTRSLWWSLPQAEQRRFLRHLRAYWEIHRHRLAPEVADKLTALIHEQRLQLHAGQLQALTLADGAFAATWRPRGTAATKTLAADWVINASGPQCDYSAIDDPLVADLLAQGLARPDPLDLGLDVTEDNALIRADGTPSASLFALGSPTKGAFWEITAVPDIRVDCAGLAAKLLGARAAVEA